MIPGLLLALGCTPAPEGAPGPATRLTLQLEPGDLMGIVRLSVEVEPPGSVWVACEAADGSETHLVEGVEASGAHTLVLRGLLADEPYRCMAHAGLATAEGEITLASLPGLPTLSATSSGSGPVGAYTLVNTQEGCAGEGRSLVAMVDPEGRVRWGVDLGPGYIIDIDATLVDADTVHLGGGWGLFDTSMDHRGTFRTMDLSGAVHAERTEPAVGLGFNHHSEPLDDGSVLTLTAADHGDHRGVAIERWHPEQGLIWSWTSEALAASGALSDSPGANSVERVSDPWGDAVWVSNFRDQSLWRIDEVSGERTHVLGPSRDFVLLDEGGAPLDEAEWFYGQHDPEWTVGPEGLEVLLYDNGNGRPGGPPYSRVSTYGVDLDALTATLLWTWTEPEWWTPVVGDADRLADDHVLITRGFGDCFTPWANRPSSLVELAPPDEVVWRLEWPDTGWSTYRAERLGGCDVFANARYCPEVEARLIELSGG